MQATQSSHNVNSVTMEFVTRNSPTDEHTKYSPFIIDSFPFFMRTVESGERKKFRGIALTAINPKTENVIDLRKAITQTRIVNIAIKNGVITEVHVHKKIMEIIAREGAFDLLLRDSLEKTHTWHNSVGIGLAAHDSTESYMAIVDLFNLLKF